MVVFRPGSHFGRASRLVTGAVIGLSAAAAAVVSTPKKALADCACSPVQCWYVKGGGYNPCGCDPASYNYCVLESVCCPSCHNRYVCTLYDDCSLQTC